MGRFVVECRGDVAVDPEGDGDRRVAEAFLDHPGVDAALECSDFYRNFYRTGRNGLLSTGTGQHFVAAKMLVRRIFCGLGST